MGRSRYKIYENQLPYFLTCTVVNWLPAFINPSIAQIILESLCFLQKEQRLTLYAYVIMENHLHLIAAADDLEKEIAHFKSYTAREIIDLLKASRTTGAAWAVEVAQTGAQEGSPLSILARRQPSKAYSRRSHAPSKT